MSNLLSNAVKFAGPEARVDVGVRTDGGDVRITVTDYGPGIPEDFHPYVFQKFTQADRVRNAPRRRHHILGRVPGAYRGTGRGRYRAVAALLKPG